MDADAMAREIAAEIETICPAPNCDCDKDGPCAAVARTIAAALRRAHDAGRAEAIEEAARKLESLGQWEYAAAIRALKEAPHG